jgi:hypothetical protein
MSSCRSRACRPLLQGVGILSLPWLAEVAARSLRSVHGSDGFAAPLEILAVELGPDRNPWILLVYAVGLTVGIRLLQSWQGPAESDPDETRSCFEAAMLAGASRARAQGMATRRRHGRWFGQFLLAAGYAATSLTPALLFTPWMDGRTVAPGVLVLADGPDDARLLAAALALGALAVNIAVLVVARLTSALPRNGEWEP